jgi:hypothetical protein
MKRIVVISLVCFFALAALAQESYRDISLRTVDELAVTLVDMDKSQASLNTAANTTLASAMKMSQAATAVADLAAKERVSDALRAQIKQMQEMNMSFSMQYLQLQSQMQNENRSYTALSNIMKTKHDTVKNSISNIR